MKKRAPANYEVGYGKPPKGHRFKPGQSGNPSGKPRKILDLSDRFERELKRKRVIVEDGQRLCVSTMEVLVKRMIDLALKGNMKAMNQMLALMAHALEREKERSTDFASLSEKELAAAYAQMRDEVSDAIDRKFKLG